MTTRRLTVVGHSENRSALAATTSNTLTQHTCMVWQLLLAFCSCIPTAHCCWVAALQVAKLADMSILAFTRCDCLGRRCFLAQTPSGAKDKQLAFCFRILGAIHRTPVLAAYRGLALSAPYANNASNELCKGHPGLQQRLGKNCRHRPEVAAFARYMPHASRMLQQLQQAGEVWIF